MKPSRPYILKALYNWLLDNDLTPHILVNAEEDNVIVPVQFIDEGQIVLNLNPSAVRDFYMDDMAVSFNARFSGQPMDVYVPMAAIMAIYARENGQGMGFGGEPGAEYYLQESLPEVDDSGKKPEAEKAEKKKPSLTVVK
ncbi:MAG: ClpXP protease specificity-enhancing factor [Neptuniibacter caesariensis]|uniref:ClpXP protease specificity-enhancing factor n=1 Tax=Neptuniibacter caesariensis TaxID=207954 RepID=A0A2G6JPS9_NEPCE|nr:MAG: ClpXP protease specificity-enhancing factor [Neptuniibacter caesariensis]